MSVFQDTFVLMHDDNRNVIPANGFFFGSRTLGNLELAVLCSEFRSMSEKIFSQAYINGNSVLYRATATRASERIDEMIFRETIFRAKYREGQLRIHRMGRTRERKFRG